MMKSTARIVSLCLLLVSMAPSAAERLAVYTVNYPLQYFAERIAGGQAEVVFPAPADGDPAFWKPDAAAIGAYQRADLVLLNGADYARWVAQVSLPNRRLVDTSAAFAGRLIKTETGVAHSHGAGEEHSHAGTAFTTWLDPQQAILQAWAIKRALVKKRPQAEAEFEGNFAALESDLRALDTELKNILSNARGQALLASHPVYQYFARAYDLDLHSVLWEPEAFPAEEQWNELAGLAATHAATWMLWEGEPLPESVARLEQMGIGSLVFDPCGNVPEAGDYLDVMQANLARLRQALTGGAQ
ncbi:MAG: metal ABC transporter substrate-binding protein [Gammaproteobacteria bacterium]|nr:metal ABC transporter substrate-binding protein [Gammaproteobacteria bacterium]